MHWLSYSHSDQALLRDPELEGTWDALVVPGTLATFYFAGTGGFVLTRGRPYIIDPRTPLLQEISVARPEPKKSHLTLANIHDPGVVTDWPDHEIALSHWQDGRWPDVVNRVIDFQEKYSSSATDKADKYAALLQEATGRSLEIDPKPPHRIVPPYWAVTGVNDPWWTLSQEAIDYALERCGAERVMPVLTLTKDTPIETFAELIGDLPEDCRATFCWSGSWDEAFANKEDIRQWSEVIDRAHEFDTEIANLYGGYLSVLLTGIGLDGVNHGIGYSEQRDVRRLGATGAPPTRYYLPALRTFLPVPTAQPVIDALPADWACKCPVCADVTGIGGVPVIDELSVEDLKRHFLICRQRELERVATSLEAELDQLDEVAEWLDSHELPEALPQNIGERLALWSSSVRSLI